MLKLERIELGPAAHALRTPLVRAGATLRERRGFRLTLHSACGAWGVGEALPLPELGTETLVEADEALRALVRRFAGASLELAELAHEIERAAPGAPAARCALDVAAHDLAARLMQRPVAALLAAAPRCAVEVNALLPAADLAGTLEAARAALAQGYRTLKLKVGAGDADTDRRRIAALRDDCGGALRLRLDANGAWSASDALRALDALAPLDIELVEQPVAARDLDGLAWLHARSPIPLAADEALASEAGRERLCSGELGSVAVLKPMVLGGLGPAVRLARAAAARGIEVVVTTALDGPIATAAALHLACAVGAPARAQGLAAADSLATPFPGALVPVRGALALAPRVGLGELDAP
jgi:o-succinylbenzoate synthase